MNQDDPEWAGARHYPELNEAQKRFWGRCGFQPAGGYIDPYKPYEPEWWLYPDNLQKEDSPPIDLNNLFKYGSPKAREILGADELTKRLQGWINDVVLCGVDPTDSLFHLFYKALGV